MASITVHVFLCKLVGKQQYLTPGQALSSISVIFVSRIKNLNTFKSCLPTHSEHAKCWHSGKSRSCLSGTLQIGHSKSSSTSCTCSLTKLLLLLFGILKQIHYLHVFIVITFFQERIAIYLAQDITDLSFGFYDLNLKHSI